MAQHGVERLVVVLLQVYFRYNSLLAQVAQQSGGAEALPGIPFDLVIQGVVTDIGLLLFVGIVAATVYGRFKMKV